MIQHANPTHALRQTLRQLMSHDVSNPDDNPHLSGVRFFCATDEHTRQLIERIELLASEAFFDPRGRAIPAHMRAAALPGVSICQQANTVEDETVIQIDLPEKGYITISTLRI